MESDRAAVQGGVCPCLRPRGHLSLTWLDDLYANACVATSQPTPDASASIFVDALRDLGSISHDVFNVAQIDVEKGPAGTDNGHGSPTGSINLVSRHAELGNAASASLTLGHQSQDRVTVDVNHQFGDTVAGRVAVMGQASGQPGRARVQNNRWGVAPFVSFGLGTTTLTTLSLLHVEQDNVPDGGVPTIGRPGYTMVEELPFNRATIRDEGGSRRANDVRRSGSRPDTSNPTAQEPVRPGALWRFTHDGKYLVIDRFVGANGSGPNSLMVTPDGSFPPGGLTAERVPERDHAGLERQGLRAGGLWRRLREWHALGTHAALNDAADHSHCEVSSCEHVREQVVATRALAEMVQVDPAAGITRKRQRAAALPQRIEAQFEREFGGRGRSNRRHASAPGRTVDLSVQTVDHPGRHAVFASAGRGMPANVGSGSPTLQDLVTTQAQAQLCGVAWQAQAVLQAHALPAVVGATAGRSWHPHRQAAPSHRRHWHEVAS